MNQRHSFTWNTVLLCAAGLAVNLLLSRLALFFSLPLFLDSIGTIVCALFGGILPGIIVAFFTNVINGISDPVTLYYAVIGILIACAASRMGKRGWFFRVGRSALAVLVFTFIGGCLGSVLTWLLYGFSFGSGISAPFAVALHESAGLPEFYAQFAADIAIDLADKFISVLVVFLLLRLMPDNKLEKFSDGRLRRVPAGDTAAVRVSLLRGSLRGKVVLTISVSALILGAAAIGIGYMLYTDTMTGHYISSASSVTEMAEGIINADAVESYLTDGENDAYNAQRLQLQTMRDNIPDVEYLYVYRIEEDGCHVVFDTDAPDLEGGRLGDIVPIEDDFLEYREKLLAGEPIEPVVSNGIYGWLLTVYHPLADSSGKTVAYAAADISMEDVMSDRAIFIIKMVSLLFGVSIIIIAFALWFAERKLVDPINAIAAAAGDFAYDSETERRKSTDEVKSLNIRTGDEIENLYLALSKTVTDVSAYIEDINRKNEIISRMQQSIILSFANLVENRDLNTGEHIRHTAGYVRAIAAQLSREGGAPEITPAFSEKIVRSAPLHDVGKIKIPDAILNKPGKLTDEEFEKIKTHTTVGRDILLGIISGSEDADYLSEAVNMAAFHHERWDGTGYPEGLRETAIPLSARIMAVADVYDALVSKRSYKSAMSPDEARAIIVSESGSHFDPAVVAAFLAAWDDISSVAL